MYFTVHATSGVGLAILTDLIFREVGVRTLETEAQAWTLVVAGSVGFLLNERWATWREAGGSKFGMATVQGQEKIRAASITFPRQGWCRVYACVRFSTFCMDEAPATSLCVLAGDFNAGSTRRMVRCFGCIWV